MRDRQDEFTARGVRVAAIGMGRPDMAAYFKDEFDIPFTLLVDHTKETYRAVEIKKGTQWDVAGPKNWVRFAKGILTGKGVAIPKQDPLQLGGTAVVDQEGTLLFIHRSSAAADNAPIDDVLEKLPARP